MSHHDHGSHGAHGEIQNPGSFQTPGTLQALFLLFIVIGVGTFFWGMSQDKARAWASFTQNHFYFLSLAVGGLFFAAVQFVSGAMWSAPIRRVSESFTAYLPVGLVAFGVLYFGIHELYPWSHPEHVNSNPVLQGKSGYLNVGFFMVRNLIAILLWILFAKKMVGNSLAQDSSKDVQLTLKNRSMAPAFLLIFAVTFTMSSFDTLMSLDPEWFSTMFGVYCFAGLFYSTLALTCVMTLYLKAKGKLNHVVNDNHLHDLGKFMFAFNVFWAYIAFSQFMLIWYANLPEETMYFLHRVEGGWKYISAFLLIGKFMLPFFILLPRRSKRNPRILGMVAVFMLFAQWIDLMWLIQPQFFESGPKLGLIEIGVTLGFAGLFGILMFRFLAKHNVLAIGDPKLHQSVFHHHV